MIELWNKLEDKTKQFIAWILIMVLAVLISVGLMAMIPWIKSPPRSTNTPRPTFKKADYSSDRSWLECRDHQLLCLYGGLWDELSAKEIFDICGHEEVCDDLFGSGTKVEGRK